MTGRNGFEPEEAGEQSAALSGLANGEEGRFGIFGKDVVTAREIRLPPFKGHRCFGDLLEDSVGAEVAMWAGMKGDSPSGMSSGEAVISTWKTGEGSDRAAGRGARRLVGHGDFLCALPLFGMSRRRGDGRSEGKVTCFSDSSPLLSGEALREDVSLDFSETESGFSFREEGCLDLS